jgi:hypothetical protein
MKKCKMLGSTGRRLGLSDPLLLLLLLSNAPFYTPGGPEFFVFSPYSGSVMEIEEAEVVEVEV